MDLSNKVIEVLNRDHGRKVKAFFKKNGANVSNFTFSNTRSNLVDRRFYGLKNNIFSCFSIKEVEFNNLTVIALPTQDIKLDLPAKKTRIKPGNKKTTKNLEKQDTTLKPRYFVKLTEANYKILNQYLHKHWKNYLGYRDTWSLSPNCGKFFCSESVPHDESYIHSVTKYPNLPTDSLLITYEFLSILDSDLWNQFKTYDKHLEEKKSVESTEDQPDFSASELIILKHLLDSNIKFDSNDFNFYRSLFQLGYDFATSTRVY